MLPRGQLLRPGRETDADPRRAAGVAAQLAELYLGHRGGEHEGQRGTARAPQLNTGTLTQLLFGRITKQA